VRRFAAGLWMVGMLVFMAADARANHFRGIRVVVTAVNAGTFTADVNVTAWTTGTGASTSADIQWGDGVTDTSQVLPFLMAAGSNSQYRGSFSHVYPDATTRTIRVENCCGYIGAGLPGNTTPNPTDPTSTTIFDTVAVDFAGAPTLPHTAALAGLALLMIAGGSFLLRRRVVA
jgi:hypothetical protein